MDRVNLIGKEKDCGGPGNEIEGGKCELQKVSIYMNFTVITRSDKFYRVLITERRDE